MNWKDYLALGWLLFSCVTCTGIGLWILAWLWAQWRVERHNRRFICPTCGNPCGPRTTETGKTQTQSAPQDGSDRA